MAQILFANDASTTLAGPLTQTATTVNVAAGTGVLFPQPGSGQIFKLTLRDAATGLVTEILNVTAVNGDSFTVQRGQENTAPQSWLAGDLADNLNTAGTMQALAQTAGLASQIYQGVDSGTAPNAVVVSSTTPQLSAPAQGQTFEIVKSNKGNTGPVTMTVGTGGAAVSVVFKDGSALVAGDWPANAAALLYYTGGVFQLVSCQGAPAVRTYAAQDTGSADALVVNPVPPVPSLLAPFQVNVIKGAASNATTGPTLNVSGLGAKPIFRCDGTILAATDLPAAALIPVYYDVVLGGYRLTAPLAPTQVPQIPVPGFTLYFDFQNGNDSNPGTATSPLKLPTTTVMDAASKFAVAGLTIQGVGTGPAIGPLPRLAGRVTIQGPSTDASKLVFTGANPAPGQSALTSINDNNTVTLANLTLENDGQVAHTVAIGGGAQVLCNNVATTSTTNGNSDFHYFLAAGLTLNGCSAQGNMGGLAQVTSTGTFQFNPNSTFTHTGSASYSIATLVAQGHAEVAIGGGAQFAGSGYVSGPQKLVQDFAILRGNGQGGNIPGTSAGTVAPTAIYTA